MAWTAFITRLLSLTEACKARYGPMMPTRAIMAMKAATHVPTSLVRATGSGLPGPFPDGGMFVEGATPIATVPDISKRLQI
jgi:hypothetical protein